MIQNKNISSEKNIIRTVIAIFVLSTSVIFLFYITNFLRYKQNEEIKIHELTAEKFSSTIKESFEKDLLFTQIISQNIEIQDNYKISKKLKQNLVQILKQEEFIVGLSLFAGDPSQFLNNKDNILQDSTSNFSILNIKKADNKVIISERLPATKILNNVNTENFNENKGILISEPYKMKTGKKNAIVTDFTSFIYFNKKITGILTVHFNTKKFTSILTTKEKNLYDFILLSPDKNIIASSLNSQNIGKNIHKLYGEEFKISSQLNQTNKKFPETLSIIQLSNSLNEYELICYFRQSSDRNIIYRLLILAVVVLIISISAVSFYILFIKRSLKPLKKLSDKTYSLSKGESSSESPEFKNEEYQKAYENLNAVSEYQKEIASFSQQIINENFDVTVKPRSDFDKTSKSLNEISAYLKEKKQKQSAEEEKTFRQLWMRKGRFEVSEAERNSSKDIGELSYNIIRSVVNYINALMGGIYLYDKENEKIELISAYAYEKHKHFNARFNPGEGVVGACVLEKKKVILNKIPEDYIKIATGLGSGSPSHIAVIPIIFKNEINAAIEVAFMDKPEDYKIEFIEQLSDSIGAWIDASVNSMKTRKLLEISEKQTLELAEKEEELNKKVEELQKIQEKTDEVNTRLKSILNAINQSVMTVEYTPAGEILTCNKVYTDVMGFEAEEIRGTNVKDLVKDQSESLIQIIEEVKKGKIIKKEVKRYTKDGKEKQLTATYTPYYDINGNISQILFFAFDITNIHI